MANLARYRRRDREAVFVDDAAAEICICFSPSLRGLLFRSYSQDDDGECGAIEFIRRNSAISPRISREFCLEPSALQSEGAGNAGRPMRPQPRV